MIPDGKSLLASQLHVAGDDINALLAVAVRKSVIILKGVNSLPHTTLVLDVAEAFFVNIHLAKIVKQGNYGNALVAILKAKVFLLLTRKKVLRIVNIQRIALLRIA